MVQGSFGRTRHQVHGADPTYTLAERQSLPRCRATRSATFSVQRVLFGFCVWDVPRCSPRSLPYSNHAIDKNLSLLPSLQPPLLSWMLSKINFTPYIRSIIYKHTIIFQTPFVLSPFLTPFFSCTWTGSTRCFTSNARPNGIWVIVLVL